MEHALTRIVVASAVIATVCCAITFGIRILNAADDPNVASLMEGGTKLCSSLYDPSSVMIYGFSTGSRQMTTIPLDTGNITLGIGGDEFSLAFPRWSLAINGLEMASPPSAEFSLGPQDCLRVYSVGNSLYLQPKVLINCERSVDMGGVSTYAISICCCQLLQGFTASGSFDILKENATARSINYEREFLYGGKVVVGVDGVPALSLDLKAGEAVSIDVRCMGVILTPVLRG